MRIGTIEDFDTVKQMALKFGRTTDYGHEFDEEELDKLITHMLTGENTTKIVLLTDGGMIAGSVNKFPFGKCYIATELAWWVEPAMRKQGVGLELLSQFETWAKHVGCKYVTMVGLTDDIAKVYEKNGYKLYERAYMKEI